jgi:hypothetical protein
MHMMRMFCFRTARAFDVYRIGAGKSVHPVRPFGCVHSRNVRDAMRGR